ncbi:MAG TPA: hypothetical protein VF171_06605 [Trueperaceae bacterium]
MALPTTTMRVRLTLTEPLLGTVPKNQDVYARYIASRAPTPENGDEEVETTPEEIESAGWTGFHSDEKGLFLYDYQVKGLLKEAGNTLKDLLGVKALRSKIDSYVFIRPRRIYLGKAEPDGVFERPLRAQTPQGPRVALARSDYVDAGTEVEFEVVVLEGPVKPKHIEAILEYGALKGLGQFRNGGFGRFTAEVEPA